MISQGEFFAYLLKTWSKKISARPLPPPNTRWSDDSLFPCLKCCFLAKRNYLHSRIKHRRDLLKNVAYVQQDTADLMHERRIAVDIQETAEAISDRSSQETVQLLRRLAAISHCSHCSQASWSGSACSRLGSAAIVVNYRLRRLRYSAAAAGRRRSPGASELVLVDCWLEMRHVTKFRRR